MDPCVVAADELTSLTQWSQAKYQLQLWMWANGCSNAEAPRHDQGWANDGSFGYPPLSFTYPGNPNDRKPPGG